MKVIIIGGTAGGCSCAARLRRLDEKAEIILFERTHHISAASCGLPYYIGDKITSKNSLTVQSVEGMKTRFQIDVRIDTEIIALNLKENMVLVRNLITKEEYQESYDKLVLATGAESMIPDIYGIEREHIFSVRTIEQAIELKEQLQKEKPKTAVVVGAGYIGIEVAENLTNIGIATTILEKSNHILSNIDYDMAQEVERYMEDKGIQIQLNTEVEKFINEGKIRIKLNKGEISSDIVILAIGVKPNTRLAKEAGIKLNHREAICVNSQMQTSQENVYAVGDAVEIEHFVTKQKTWLPLAGPANKQGRIVADNLSGLQTHYAGGQGSSIIKIMDMAVASTGITEKQAKDLFYNYDKVYVYASSHATYYPDATFMQIKAIFEKNTGKILGAQIVGFDGVDKRSDILATAIRANMTGKDLTEIDLCYAPPFGSAKDPINMVGYAIENIVTGKVKQFHWDKIKDLPRDGSVTLLDTRTKQEFELGAIEGFFNIPLDELREHLDELDKNKPIYLYCKSGLRSYLASRILTQAGYKNYHLSGGYHFYENILRNKIEHN